MLLAVRATSQNSASVNTHYSPLVVSSLGGPNNQESVRLIAFGSNGAADQLTAVQTGEFVANLMDEVKGDAQSWI